MHLELGIIVDMVTTLGTGSRPYGTSHIPGQASKLKPTLLPNSISPINSRVFKPNNRLVVASALVRKQVSPLK